MFTGIIEGLGTILQIHSSGQTMQLALATDFDLAGTRIGDSIAVNGVCLTVVRVQNRRFSVDLSPETLSRTTFSNARVGGRVNLERALRLSDRLDGHLVSGHVDGIGRLEGRETAANAIVLSFSAPEGLTRYMIPKGSVAVDGISLTINTCNDAGFQVSIIPHTARVTTIGLKKEGDEVNIETDLIGKYVERFWDRTQGKTELRRSGVDWQLLARSGFVDSK